MGQQSARVVACKRIKECPFRRCLAITSCGEGGRGGLHKCVVIVGQQSARVVACKRIKECPFQRCLAITLHVLPMRHFMYCQRVTSCIAKASLHVLPKRHFMYCQSVWQSLSCIAKVCHRSKAHQNDGLPHPPPYTRSTTPPPFTLVHRHPHQTCTRVHSHVHTCIHSRTHMHTHICTHALTHTCVHTYTRTLTHTYIRAHMHTHTYTHT